MIFFFEEFNYYFENNILLRNRRQSIQSWSISIALWELDLVLEFFSWKKQEVWSDFKRGYPLPGMPMCHPHMRD